MTPFETTPTSTLIDLVRYLVNEEVSCGRGHLPLVLRTPNAIWGIKYVPKNLGASHPWTDCVADIIWEKL